MADDKHQLAHNPDLALRTSREHHHEHLHHSAHAEKGRTDDPAYTIGTTDEPRVIPHQDRNDDALHRSQHSDGKDPAMYDEKHYKYDAEKASVSQTHTGSEEEDPQRHKVSRFYRHYRVFFHIALGALFTG